MSEKEGYTNGMCQAHTDWKEFRQEMKTSFMKIDALRGDTRHLEGIASCLSDMKGQAFDALLGRDIVPLDVHKELMEGQRESYVKVIKTLCWAFGVIVVFLTGINYYLQQ